MYHLLAHLADPSDWTDASDLATETPPANALPFARMPPAVLPTQESGSLFRAPVPRPHVSR